MGYRSPLCRYKKIVASHHIKPRDILRYWQALEGSLQEECPDNWRGSFQKCLWTTVVMAFEKIFDGVAETPQVREGARKEEAEHKVLQSLPHLNDAYG